MNEEEAFLILNSIPHLGPAKLRSLVQHFGTANEALKASEAQLSALPGFERIVPYWKNCQKERAWQLDLDLVMQRQVTLLPFTHPEFPRLLLKTPDCPALLYVKGAIKRQDQGHIAIVGTRYSSIYGNEMAENISQALSIRGFTVVSGLARGIDTAAHRGALKGGRTVAVIGSGLADIYPSENRNLAEAIVQKGALISEFPMAAPPDRQNFPQRNRIVSGMTLASLLIEAPMKSGAMITMQKAHEYERRLFALPGRADSDQFRGNHYLIKTGKAQLIENAEDICAHFESLLEPCHIKPLDRQLPLLDNEEKQILRMLAHEESSIEDLALKSKLPVHQLHRILMSLVLKKAVKEFPGKIYKKIAAQN